MPITVVENVVSNAERRSLTSGDTDIVPRISDVYAALPAMTGKIELEYEGELVGAAAIARELIRRAADATFQGRAGGVNVDDIVMWFDEVVRFVRWKRRQRSPAVLQALDTIPGLLHVVHHVGLAVAGDTAVEVAACELVLEALVARKRISRSDGGRYTRTTPEPRRKPNQDLFGGGMA